MDSSHLNFFAYLAIVGVLLLYFLPFLIAGARGHKNSGPIFIVLFFLGWTVIGWIVALAWGFSSNVDKSKESRPVYQVLIAILVIIFFVLIGVGAASASKWPNVFNSSTLTTSAKPAAGAPVPIQTDLSYGDFIKFENLKSGKGYGQFDVEGVSEPKRGIFGTVRNTGDRAVDELVITFYFLNRSKTRIGEKNYTVVTSDSIFDSKGPLKPQYVRDFGVLVEDDAPREWGGDFDLRIKDVKVS